MEVNDDAMTVENNNDIEGVTNLMQSVLSRRARHFAFDCMKYRNFYVPHPLVSSSSSNFSSGLEQSRPSTSVHNIVEEELKEEVKEERP